MATREESLHLLLIDYEKSLAAVDKFDGIVVQILSWSIVTSGATLAYACDKKSIAFAAASCAIASGFFILACIFKAFQIDAMNHVFALETLLAGTEAEKANAESKYVFGIGHAIQKADQKRTLWVGRHPAFWYLRLFYFVLLATAIGAIFWIMSERNQPNHSPNPTPASVTPAAAQPTRQP
jgi:hypothetical protein